MVAFILPRQPEQSSVGLTGGRKTQGFMRIIPANGYDLLPCALQGLRILYSWAEQETAEGRETEGIREDNAEQTQEEWGGGPRGSDQCTCRYNAEVLDHMLETGILAERQAHFVEAASEKTFQTWAKHKIRRQKCECDSLFWVISVIRNFDSDFYIEM